MIYILILFIYKCYLILPVETLRNMSATSEICLKNFSNKNEGGDTTAVDKILHIGYWAI